MSGRRKTRAGRQSAWTIFPKRLSTLRYRTCASNFLKKSRSASNTLNAWMLRTSGRKGQKLRRRRSHRRFSRRTWRRGRITGRRELSRGGISVIRSLELKRRRRLTLGSRHRQSNRKRDPNMPRYRLILRGSLWGSTMTIKNFGDENQCNSN